MWVQCMQLWLMLINDYIDCVQTIEVCILMSPYLPALNFSSLQHLLSIGRSVLTDKFKAGRTAMAYFLLLMQHESLYTPLCVVKRDFSDSFLEHRQVFRRQLTAMLVNYQKYFSHGPTISSYLPCQLRLGYQTLIAIINHGVNLDSNQEQLATVSLQAYTAVKLSLLRRAYSFSQFLYTPKSWLIFLHLTPSKARISHLPHCLGIFTHIIFL